MSRVASRPIRLGILASRVRFEEKSIFAALEQRRVDYEVLDERRLSFSLGRRPAWEYAAVLNRAMSHTRAFYAARLLESVGTPAVNSSEVIRICGDKLLTSLALCEAGVPIPHTALALASDAAIPAIEEMGFPVVVKPVIGSWGRLMAKVNDRDAVEAVLEHKRGLGSAQHSIVYLQKYVEKPGRDIRTIVVGDEVVSAIYRYSNHWITNIARGGRSEPCPITRELAEISLRAARAVGGGVLAVDVLEDPQGALVVSEVNHTMEFHGTEMATGVDVAGRLVDFVLARRRP